MPRLDLTDGSLDLPDYFLWRLDLEAVSELDKSSLLLLLREMELPIDAYLAATAARKAAPSLLPVLEAKYPCLNEQFLAGVAQLQPAVESLKEPKYILEPRHSEVTVSKGCYLHIPCFTAFLKPADFKHNRINGLLIGPDGPGRAYYNNEVYDGTTFCGDGTYLTCKKQYETDYESDTEGCPDYDQPIQVFSHTDIECRKLEDHSLVFERRWRGKIHSVRKEQDQLYVRESNGILYGPAGKLQPREGEELYHLARNFVVSERGKLVTAYYWHASEAGLLFPIAQWSYQQNFKTVPGFILIDDSIYQLSLPEVV